MSTPRIEPVEPPYPADVQAHFDTLMRAAPPWLLFRTVARNPRVLQRMMAGGLLDRGSIPLRTREHRQDLTVHGFRSTFRDWAAERTEYPSEMAEISLATPLGRRSRTHTVAVTCSSGAGA